MECAIHIVESKEKLRKFSEKSWTKFLSVVHRWANLTEDSTEAAMCKNNIQLYGLEETQPFDVLVQKGTSMGLQYHPCCYKKIANTTKLEEIIARVARKQLVIGKYLYKSKYWTGKTNFKI